MAAASIAFAGSVVQAQEPVPAAAAVSFGTIVGLVTDAAKTPIGGATVTAIRAGGGIRSTISGSDGIYSFADVPPGSWVLTITVEGLPDVRVPSLNVVAGTATRHDIAMNLTATPKPSAPALPAAPKVAAAAPAVPTLPEALQAPEPGPENDTQTPWANVGYVGWMNGTSREKAPIFDTKFFTPEIR
ncbi:MAG: carboxypeptidase-like regulatory domain-containing protein, partial [Steroidobacteraceae bacterium]